MTNRSEVKTYKSLSRNSIAEDYAKTLEEMYLDVVTVPMFDDKDTLIDKWGIEWFHIETQDEIGWTIITCMMNFINRTGHERMCLGLETTMFKDNMGIPLIYEKSIEKLDELDE